MATENWDLSTHIHRALADAGPHMVSRVETWMGWGDIQNVRVHTSVAKRDAPSTLPSTIREVIGVVLEGKRHSVEIN